MGVRILHDPVGRRACLYDSTEGVAFGPVFDEPDDEFPDELQIYDAEDVADAFLAHLRQDLEVEDVRESDRVTLAKEYVRWRTALLNGQPEAV